MMLKKRLKKLPYANFLGVILSTTTFRQSSITFSGTLINGALGAVFFILAARFLGPSQFGLFSVAIAVLTLVADVGDLGTDTGLVNFVARNKGNPEKANRFLKLGLKIKLIVSGLVLVLGVLFAPLVSTIFFKKPELAPALNVAFIGVGAFLLFSYIIHALQALQKFWWWSVIQIATNAVRTLLIIGILFFGLLTLENSMWIYVSMPFLGFIVGMKLLPKGFLKVKNENSVAKEFFKYNKWVAAFTLLAAVSSRLDIFISARLLDAAEVGIYSAANQLVKIVPQIVVALGTVIAPKMAGMGSLGEFVKYLKKTQAMVLGIAGAGLLSIPVVLYLIPPLFGKSYVSSGPVFVVLLLAMLIFLISVPIHMSVFYYFSYPRLFFWIALGHFLIITLLGWQLIGAYGAMGAAVTVLVGQVFNLLVPAGWVLSKIRNA